MTNTSTNTVTQNGNGNGNGNSRQVQVRVPADLHRRLKTATSACDMTMRELFMELAEGWLADNHKQHGLADGDGRRAGKQTVRSKQ